MKRPPILPIGTPDRPRHRTSITPIDDRRRGLFVARTERAVLAALGLGLLIRGLWPW